MLQGGTITAKYCTDGVLPHVLQKCDSAAPARSRSRLLLRHDNVGQHKAKLTVTYLEENNINLLRHPPYSLDLASCDFWLFPKIKANISGRPFQRIQYLTKAVNLELRTIPMSEYHSCFQKWRMRMERCVEVHGKYFEGW